MMKVAFSPTEINITRKRIWGTHQICWNPPLPNDAPFWIEIISRLLKDTRGIPGTLLDVTYWVIFIMIVYVNVIKLCHTTQNM